MTVSTFQGQDIKLRFLDEIAKTIVESKNEPLPDEPPLEEIPEFMVGHEFSYIDGLDSQEYVHDNVHEPRDSPVEANLISSKMKNSNKHRVILDLDFPAALIPSSTPGHFHLYLDKELTKEDMDKLVSVLYEVGIIAEGNRNQWDRFKALFLRLPWIKKGEAATEDSPKE